MTCDELLTNEMVIRIYKNNETVYINQLIDCMQKRKFEYYLNLLPSNFKEKTKEELLVVFKESFSHFGLNIIKGKYNPEKSRFDTYFFAIFKNKMLNIWRNRNRIIDIDPEMLNRIENNDSFAVTNDLIAKIDSVLNLLPEFCKTYIEMHYYEKLKNREIAAILGYASGDVVKTMFNRDCKKKLKAMLQTIHHNN